MQAEIVEVRHTPSASPQVLPFSFMPPLDVIAAEASVIVEAVLPGVDREDVTVERVGDTLVISGVRRDEHGASGFSYHHTETPRGPFHRVVPLPFALAGEPRVELDRGVLRVHLTIAEVEPGDGQEASGNHDSNQEKP